MNGRKRIFLCLGIFACLLLLCGVMFWYCTEVKRTQILQSTSPDGMVCLTVWAVGEPEFPYGPAGGSMELARGKESLLQIPFEIYDDGAQMTQADFQIDWGNETVTVTVSGSEQEAAVWVLDYRGAGVVVSPTEEKY